MAAKTTDIQRKKIVADYLETQSINAAANRNGVSWATARSVISGMRDIETKLEQKKEENTADIVSYMEDQKEQVCNIIKVALSVLPEKIRNAKTASEVTTALGTLIDKWSSIGGGRGTETNEDALSKSLREMAEGLESDG